MRPARRVTAFALALAGVAAGCHRSGTSRVATAPAPDAPDLGGTWSTGCVADADSPGSFVTETRRFTGQDYEATFAAFGDEACKVPLSTQTRKGTFVVGAKVGAGDARALDVSLLSTALTLHTAELVKAYDEAKICGGGWTLDTEKTLEHDACRGDDGQPEGSDFLFNVVAVRGAALYLGRMDGAHAGRSAATRPGAVDGTRPFARR